MLIAFVLIFVLDFEYVYNKGQCGCQADRSQSGGIQSKYIDGVQQSDADQCPLENKNGLKSSSEKEISADMVSIPAGEYQFGTDDEIIESDFEGPQKIVKLKPFLLDRYEVSNRDFMKFVSSTSYKSEAEIFGDSFVFGMFLNDTFKEELIDFRVAQTPWWFKVDGAYWSRPFGPDSNITDIMDHPVVHVSWRDARSYCKWRGARLPTEREWEAACRGGAKGTIYPWGNKMHPKRKHMANIWQGKFPDHNAAKDGFIGTNPVNIFRQNKFGLYNMAGNVWEWTADVWSKVSRTEKVKKGGSYLCHRTYCFRYRCSARAHNTEDSSAGNLGFRCAKSL